MASCLEKMFLSEDMNSVKRNNNVVNFRNFKKEILKLYTIIDLLQ